MEKVKNFLTKYVWVLAGYAVLATLGLMAKPVEYVETVKTVQTECKQAKCEPEVIYKDKVVYQDSKATLDALDAHNQVACAYAGVYPPMFDIMLAYASDWGLSDMITQDTYDLLYDAQEYQNLYCN